MIDLTNWSLSLVGSDDKEMLSLSLSGDKAHQFSENGGISVTVAKREIGDALLFEATARAQSDADCFFRLMRTAVSGDMLAFSGAVSAHEIFRQSPHDPNQHQLDMCKQAVPMAAAKLESGYETAVSDAPLFCENYTTQEFEPEKHRFSLCSGDSGRKPGYQGGLSFAPYFHRIGTNKTHVFRFFIFRSPAQSVARLRLDIFRAVESCFGQNTSLYHAVCFATNYMHLRRNETGASRCWVVSGIDYGNKQYTRDGFWQSMILPADIARECYLALTPDRYRSAENPLIEILWSYRVFKAGDSPLADRLNDALSIARKWTKDGCYHPAQPNPNACGFRSWFDLCAHTDSDVITYNQGLYAAAMRAAQKMGYASEAECQLAAERYRGLFREDLGIYPLSREKIALCVDAFAGDLISRLLFGDHLLPDHAVLSHYRIVCERAQTPFGIKVSAELDGSYHDKSFFGANGRLNSYFDGPDARPGRYIWGSSYFIYEMLFHIDAFLHGAPDAEQRLIDRTLLDFSLGSTYFEHIDTVTGQPGKPNQGWNAAIYALWAQLMREGVASNRYFDEVERYLNAIK